VSGEGHSDWTKHVAGWNKSESAKVRDLCFVWIWSVEDLSVNILHTLVQALCP